MDPACLVSHACSLVSCSIPTTVPFRYLLLVLVTRRKYPRVGLDRYIPYSIKLLQGTNVYSERTSTVHHMQSTLHMHMCTRKAT